MSVLPSPQGTSEKISARSPALPSSAVQRLVGVEEGYERWAATYDQYPNPLIAREERHVAPLLPDLTGKSVLDLACGTGRWLQKLLERGARLGVGIDNSAAMLRVAGRKASIRGQLARADCLQLPFPAAIFDFAICSFALSHIQGLYQAALELGRVMKANATVVATDLHPEAHQRGWRTGFRDERSAVEIHVHPRSAEGVLRAFHTAGFECISYVSLCLGDAEEAILRRGGKAPMLADACRVPAVLVSWFRRRDNTAVEGIQ